MNVLIKPASSMWRTKKLKIALVDDARCQRGRLFALERLLMRTPINAVRIFDRLFQRQNLVVAVSENLPRFLQRAILINVDNESKRTGEIYASTSSSGTTNGIFDDIRLVK